jgi:hypothetical protein
MKLALREEKNLIKLIEKISTNNLKEIRLSTLEESVKKTISLFVMGVSISVIISYWKNMINNLPSKLNFSFQIYQSLYDCLLLASSNTVEEKADVNYLLGYVKGKLNQVNNQENISNQENNQENISNRENISNYHTFRADGISGISNLINSFSNNN